MALSRPLLKEHTIIIIGVCFLLLDRFLKILALNGVNYDLISNFLSFTLSKNYEAALSLKLGFNVVYLAAPITLIIFLCLIILWKKNKPLAMVFLIITLGACSNLFDRIVYGYVIDYFEVAKLSILNLSDILIVGGAATLLWPKLDWTVK